MSIPETVSRLPGGCERLRFPRIRDARGSLSVVEAYRHVPFAIRRIFYIYGVPEHARRGGHAHRELQEVVVALGGTLDVVLDDGIRRVRVHLAHPQEGLYIAPMVWAEEESFSSGSVALVVASEPYEEHDYVCEYDAFCREVSQERFHGHPVL